jgi:two-component system chemotaxis sensor kinase CheA
MAGGQNFLRNFLYSGRRDLADNETISYALFNVILLIGALFLILFGTSVYLEGDVFRSLLDACLALVCIVAIFVLRTKVPLAVPGAISIAAFGVLCARFIAGGEIRGFGALWVYIFPLVTIFVLGLQIGLIYTVLLFCTMLTLTFIPGLSKYDYTIGIAARFCGVYILVAVLSVVYEQVRLLKDRRVNRLTEELRVERDTISAMKDNLKQGVFLMDRNFVIQGAYSRPLEKILLTPRLEGVKFTDLLVHSLTEKERNTLEDYFDMILKKSYNAQILEDINPISEFTYLSEQNAGVRVLRSSFSAIDRGLNDIRILGALEDVTLAKEMEQQLAAEAGRREEEMRSFFQIIQVDPRVFKDFLEDTEYEFERINATLMNKGLSARDALVEIYQSIHAIKSNSVILGLDNFGEKLHVLEDAIKEMRDREDISFEDTLHVTLELEKIFKEKDKFQNTVGKIESFKISGGVKREEQVLVETLSRICDKAALAVEKKARFIAEEIDEIALENGPRRVIKEVLMQLVRNSVYHGIEAPADRKKEGKDGEGVIRFSLRRQDGRIHIRFSDDGKGLDFGKIREKALDLRLISDEKEADDKNLLSSLIFSPGFSTAEEADLYAGRGIGLNLVRERIRDLRGSIKLSSEPGKGTVFNIVIPCETSAEENQAS